MHHPNFLKVTEKRMPNCLKGEFLIFFWFVSIEVGDIRSEVKRGQVNRVH